MIDLKAEDWKLYLSRPFDLLMTSIWNQWYFSAEFNDLFACSFSKGLFIEYPFKTACCYRNDNEIKAFKKSIENIVLNNSAKTKLILTRALDLNNEVESILNNKTTLTLTKASQKLTELALHATIFPLYAGEILIAQNQTDKELIKICEKLRAISYYSRFLDEILLPLCETVVEENGYQKEEARVLTFKELMENNFQPITERKEKINQGKYFVYYCDTNSEDVSYINNPQELFSILDGQISTEEIKGSVAYAGKAQGRVKIILNNDIDAITFNVGDVLVAISTNPVLTPLMEKAAAIVTDEGGITSHAAIIARELKKPCIIGAKNATRILKDGDMVEVDADKGIVRVLS